MSQVTLAQGAVARNLRTVLQHQQTCGVDYRDAAAKSSNRGGRVEDHEGIEIQKQLGEIAVAAKIDATASAGLASYTSSGVMTSATADFSHTLNYGGSAGVLIGGMLFDSESLVAGSGIDWHSAAPVPEPSSWALMLAGVVLLAHRRLRP